MRRARSAPSIQLGYSLDCLTGPPAVGFVVDAGRAAPPVGVSPPARFLSSEELRHLCVEQFDDGGTCLLGSRAREYGIEHGATGF